MNGRAYSEGDLSMMINAARQYIQAPDVQREIISKCHQEIGLIMVDSPPHQRAAINLTNLESKAILDAVRSWQITGRLRKPRLHTARFGLGCAKTRA